jgi:hypothetical protein
MAGKKSKKARKVNDWDAIREDYLIQNLDQSRDTPYTFRAVAKTWGVSRSSVEGHAKKEDWRAELITRAKVQANANLERRTETIAEVEREARKRHAQFCRGLVAKSILRFNAIENPATEISIDQMLKMIQFAMPEERAALGIPRYLSVQTTTPTDTEREMETPGMRIERRRLEREVKKELTELIARAAEEDDGN